MSTTQPAFQHWLAQADPDPDHVAQWWKSAGFVRVPVGRTWEVIAVPDAADIRLALEQCDTAGWPIICVPQDQVLYFLVPTGTRWSLPGTHHLSKADYVALPAPDRCLPPGPYWLSLPAPVEQLTEPAALHALLATIDFGSTANTSEVTP